MPFTDRRKTKDGQRSGVAFAWEWLLFPSLNRSWFKSPVLEVETFGNFRLLCGYALIDYILKLREQRELLLHRQREGSGAGGCRYFLPGDRKPDEAAGVADPEGKGHFRFPRAF
jgi:hypothetical protein